MGKFYSQLGGFFYFLSALTFILHIYLNATLLHGIPVFPFAEPTTNVLTESTSRLPQIAPFFTFRLFN